MCSEPWSGVEGAITSTRMQSVAQVEAHFYIGLASLHFVRRRLSKSEKNVNYNCMTRHVDATTIQVLETKYPK